MKPPRPRLFAPASRPTWEAGLAAFLHRGRSLLRGGLLRASSTGAAAFFTGRRGLLRGLLHRGWPPFARGPGGGLLRGALRAGGLLRRPSGMSADLGRAAARASSYFSSTRGSSSRSAKPNGLFSQLSAAKSGEVISFRFSPMPVSMTHAGGGEGPVGARRLQALAHPGAACHPRHHHVEDHEVRVMLLCQAPTRRRRRAPPRPCSPWGALRTWQGDQAQHRRLVFGDQDREGLLGCHGWRRMRYAPDRPGQAQASPRARPHGPLAGKPVRSGRPTESPCRQPGAESRSRRWPLRSRRWSPCAPVVGPRAPVARPCDPVARPCGSCCSPLRSRRPPV